MKEYIIPILMMFFAISLIVVFIYWASNEPAVYVETKEIPGVGKWHCVNERIEFGGEYQETCYELNK